MLAAFKTLLGFKEQSSSEESESEFSSINSDEFDDSDNDSKGSEEEEQEETADFQRGDLCSFCPNGQKKWSNGTIIKYRYPNQFTLKISGSGRVCLGIRREQLHLPIKVVPATTFLSYSRGEVVDVVRKKKIRSVEDARKALVEANQGKGEADHFNDQSWEQGQVLKVYHDSINAHAPPWFKIRFEGGQIDREVEEKNIKKVFRKGDLVEVRAEGWAEYYRGRIVKKTGRRKYNIVVQEDGELITDVERVRIRSIGDQRDHVKKMVSDNYRAIRRKYVNYLKSGNFRGMLRMIDNDGIHPDHEDPMTGRNGLIKACLTNQYKRAKEFVEVGADVDYETMSGLTPLIACAEKGSIKVAKAILLDPFNRPLADPFRKNKLGKTARDIAVEKKRTRFIAFFDSLTSKEDYEYARRHNVEIKIIDPGAAAKLAALAMNRLKNKLQYNASMQNKAASVLQSKFRGYLSRKHLKLRLEQENKERLEYEHKEYLRKIKKFYRTVNITKLQRTYRKMIQYRKGLLKFQRNQASKTITKFFRNLKKIQEVKQQRAVQKLFDSTWHIRLIQSYVKKFRARSKFQKQRAAILCIQCAYRRYVACVIIGDLYEKQWIEDRRRENHLIVINELKRNTEELNRLFTFQLMKDEWVAGNILVHAVRLYRFKKQRTVAKEVIQRSWLCYRSRQLLISLKQWKQRTDSSLNTFFHINGLQVTYSMSPNQTNSAKQNMLHPGLGLHRRRKKCTQCICMEFHPAPQESMCVHPKGPQVCRCGHHVGRHLFMKGKKGNLNRLTWREKINEATQVPVTELLVRSLERSDARHAEHIRLRAEVKNKALMTDKDAARKSKGKTKGKGKGKKMGSKKKTKTLKNNATKMLLDVEEIRTMAWPSPENRKKNKLTLMKRTRKKEKKLLRWHQKQEFVRNRGTIIANHTKPYSAPSTADTTVTSSTSSTSSTASSYTIMESFSDAFSHLPSPTLPKDQPLLVSMQLQLSGTEYYSSVNRGKINPFLLQNQVEERVEEMSSTTLPLDMSLLMKKMKKRKKKERKKKKSRFLLPEVKSPKSSPKSPKQRNNLQPPNLSNSRSRKKRKNQHEDIPFREHPLFIDMNSEPEEDGRKKVLKSEMSVKKSKSNSKSTKIRLIQSKRLTDVNKEKEAKKIHTNRKKPKPIQTPTKIRRTEKSKTNVEVLKKSSSSIEQISSPRLVERVDPVARATAMHRKAVGLSANTKRTSQQSTFLKALASTSSTTKDGSLKIRFVPATRLKKSRYEQTKLKEIVFDTKDFTRITVGRDSKCEFTLDSTAYPKILSKMHCVIVLQKGGRLMLVDNGSTNGTLVNGTRVDKRKPMPLASGSLVVFGGKRSDLSYEIFVDK